jgi:RND family efflux transporter MFP subunit
LIDDAKGLPACRHGAAPGTPARRDGAAPDAPVFRGDAAPATRRRAWAVRSLPATALLAALLLSACKEENRFVPPPPPRVTVAVPVELNVPRYIETTGTAASVNQVDLVARVPGFLQEIRYRDGAVVKQGDVLFVVEPLPYQTSVLQAQGALASAQAAVVQAEAEFVRQSTLGRDQFAAQSVVDQARAKRDEARAQLVQAQASLQTAQINLGYTSVAAPFDGPVSAHTKSVGELVGEGQPTTLATIVQLDPIWVNFTVSQADILRIRQELRASGLTEIDLSKVIVEVGLTATTDFPIAGTLDYVAPAVDAGTGTLAARAVFANPDRVLLPGFFVRIRVRMPEGSRQVASLLVPEIALGEDQSGPYLLVVNGENVIEQRNIRRGPRVGTMRVVESGLKTGDRVVVNGLQRAIPGAKVDPQVQVLTPPTVPPLPEVRPVAATAPTLPSSPTVPTPVQPAADAPAPAAAPPAQPGGSQAGGSQAAPAQQTSPTHRGGSTHSGSSPTQTNR